MKFRNSSSILLGICFWRKGRGNQRLAELIGGERGLMILTGTTSVRNGRVVLTKVTDLKSVFGKSKPGKANG